MAQELPLELYRWLVAQQVLDQAKPVFRPNGKCQVDVATANQLTNGIRIAKLVLALSNDKGLNVEAVSLSSVKNSGTPASRLYNWNILSEALEAIGAALPKATQKEILSGSFAALVEFLLKLMRKFSPLPSTSLQPLPIKDKPEEKKPKPSVVDTQLNVDKLQVGKPADQSSSLLQFIILVIAQNLQLPPKQVLALLGDGCNYFAHLLVKGVKGSYEQLVKCLERFRQLKGKFAQLLESDKERNFEFVLQLLKPGLLSKSEDVVGKTVEVLVDLFQLLKGDQWLFKQLCQESTLFETLYLSHRRHPHLIAELSHIILCVSEGNVNDFFTIYFRKSANNDAEYLRTILALLDTLIAVEGNRQLIQSSGVVVSWMRLCQQLSALPTESIDTKIFSTELLCRLCLQFPTVLDEVDSSLDTLLQILKRQSRGDSQILKVMSINRLFDMLEHTARNKNRYAPLLYKKMIFLYLENHQETEIRELVLLSFIRLFREFPNIPVDLIVEPFIKQLQVAEGSTYLLNLFDLAFIKEMVAHPKLSVKCAAMLAEFLMKLYLRNLVFYKQLLKCIAALCERFVEVEEFQEAVVRQIKDYLTAYYALTQKRRGKPQDATIIAGQKRSLVVELLKQIIQLEVPPLNDKLKVMIGQSYSSLIETKKYNDKGLFALLSIFGVPEALIEQIRSQQQNEFKEVYAPTEVPPSQTHRPSPQRKPDTLKRNYTNPKNIIPPVTPQPDNNNDKSFEEQLLLKKHNIGYKQKLPARLINRSVDNLKADEKVLNDIQKVKLKFIQQQSKQELIKLQEQRRQQWNKEAVKGQILQKNISLGFTRVGDISGRMLYDFGTVKEAALPSHLQLIRLEEEEDRDSKSVELTLKHQARIIKLLFNVFSNTSQAARRLAGLQQDDEPPYISFTETVRLLKDWNLGKLPSKVIVSEIIKQLNSDLKKDRNVLMGVSEEQFPQLLTQFTSVLDIYDPDTRNTTLPLGFKLGKLLSNITDGEIQKFDEPDQSTIQSNFEKIGQIPSGYRKVIEKTLELRSTVRVDVPQQYGICLGIVDELLRGLFGTGPIEGWTELVQKAKIKKIQVKAKPPRIAESAVQLRRKTQSKDKLVKPPTKEKTETDRQEELKEQRRQQRAKRAKMELEEQRAKKMQEDAVLKKKEKEEQLEKERKKELQRKKEIEDKKEQLKLHKLKLDEDKQLKDKQKKQQEETEQERKKEQRQKFFRKQKEKLKEQFQEKSMKLREGTVANEKKKQQEDSKKQQLTKKVNNILAEDKKTKQKQHEQNRAIKQLLQEGKVRSLIEKYDAQLKGIYKHYSEMSDFKIEKTVKTLDMKGFSALVKDYNISPQLYKLQNCLVVYKYTMRQGNLKEGLNYDQFLEILVRIASKSKALLTENQKGLGDHPGDNEFSRQQNVNQVDEQLTSLTPQVVERLFRHMKLDQRRYKPAK